MTRASVQDRYFLLCLITLQVVGRAYGNSLKVGEELKEQAILLQTGSRIYQLQGLRPSMWYEVKISYPASVGSIKVGLVFTVFGTCKTDTRLDILFLKNIDNTKPSVLGWGETFVTLTVEPEGVVAIPNEKERAVVVYNIVCDELVLGISRKALWVVILAVVCLGVAFMIPSFLPFAVISKDRTRAGRVASKSSD
ncbi:uncharacterized protein LOC143533764 [Bidens hawaiensis]|uniref:uncharacterized protein LOC143533764 n=1 Tax=Bidens hawaiensis TaxID=980011 RepID=UPI0040492257